MSFTPVVKFDNRVFIPKIVPLVYDDTLSYYEFVNKLITKINEAITSLNALGIRVDDLETAVQQLQNVIDGIDDRLTAAEGDIRDVKADIVTINGAIETINGAIDTLNTNVGNNTANISSLQSTVSGMQSTISDILDDIADLPSDVAGLEGDVSNLDTRVTTLESAAFGDLTLSPVPKNFQTYMVDISKVDYEISIDYDTRDPDWDDQVELVENPASGLSQFRFRGSSNYNETHLILKNFCSVMDTDEAVTLITAFNTSWEYPLKGQAVNTSFGALLSGINCVLGDYTTICVGGAKLVLSEDNAFIYDLHLYVDSQSGSGDYIDNSNYYLDYVALLGGTGYLSDGLITGDEVEAYLNNFNLNAGDGVSPSDFNALATRVTAAEGDIDTLESTVSSQGSSITSINTSITNINTKNNQQDSAISTANSNITALQTATTPEVWDRWQDVYDEGSITPNSRIIGFHMEKIGKLVTFEIAGCHFRNDSNHNATTFCLGTIRSGLRSKLAPRGNVPVTFTGMTAYTDGNLTGLEQSGDSGSQYTPLVPNARGVAVLTIYGSDTTVPYTWSGRTNQAYSINVNICGMPYQTADSSVTNNAFIIRGCYVTV